VTPLLSQTSMMRGYWISILVASVERSLCSPLQTRDDDQIVQGHTLVYWRDSDCTQKNGQLKWDTWTTRKSSLSYRAVLISNTT
jgi:hypothetical protein